MSDARHQAAVRTVCNAMENSPGCLYPDCDCKKLPRAVIAALEGGQKTRPAREFLDELRALHPKEEGNG